MMNGASTMSDEWQYQIRINLEDTRAETARRDPQDPSLAPIGSFASLQYEVRPSFVHASGAFASEMTPSLASFNRSK